MKFVDRTFNCNKKHAMAIWRHLAQQDNGHTNFHFELAGELMDEEMMEFLQGVRPGLFQFEIGVQSTNEETLGAINRKANLPLLFSNVQKLSKPGNIHLHLDLIAGLPFEGAAQFEKSFNQVYTQQPHQFQLGILKVLPGSGMEEKTGAYGIRYAQKAPFEVLYTKWLPYQQLCRLNQIAHMVELYYNSGRFTFLVRHICAAFATPFAFYNALAEFYDASGYFDRPLSKLGQYNLLGAFMQNHGISLTEVAQYLCRYDMCLHEKIKVPPEWVGVNGALPLQQESLHFYRNGENIKKYLPEYEGYEPKQIRKMAHIEAFPLNPQTGEETPCVLLFNYARRSITGQAQATQIVL